MSFRFRHFGDGVFKIGFEEEGESFRPVVSDWGLPEMAWWPPPPPALLWIPARRRGRENGEKKEEEEYEAMKLRIQYMYENSTAQSIWTAIFESKGIADMLNRVEYVTQVHKTDRELLEEYNYPVCFNFPAGHAAENFPLIMGATIEMEVTKQGSSIHFVND